MVVRLRAATNIPLHGIHIEQVGIPHLEDGARPDADDEVGVCPCEKYRARAVATFCRRVHGQRHALRGSEALGVGYFICPKQRIIPPTPQSSILDGRVRENDAWGATDVSIAIWEHRTNRFRKHARTQYVF